MDKAPLDIVWVLVSAGLVFLMQAGFMCLESGLTRSKNSINVAIKNLADFGLSVVMFWLFGFGLMFGISHGGWVGTTDFFPDLNGNQVWLAAFFLFQAMFCGTATTIVSGAIAERIKFVAYLIIALLLSGPIYTMYGHWAWNGIYHEQSAGWLESMGFVDFAGSTVVHGIGAWVALAAAMVVGPRLGRFDEEGRPRHIQASNLPMAVLGTLLLWLGWFGFNGGSTLAADAAVAGIFAHTCLAAAAGLVTAGLLGLLLERRPAVDKCMNGALAGLVAITANCHCVNTPSALVIGSVGAVVMLLGLYLLEWFRVDDAVGAIPVHGFAGVWGTLAVGIFGNLETLGTGLTRWEQIGVQAGGAATAFVWAFGLTFVVLWTINRLYPLRVTAEEEEVGLNISEHGASTELLDFFREMEKQAQTGDLALRMPVEPFTEVGQIARRYNKMLDTLQRSLAQTDAIVRTAADGIVTFVRDGLRITFANPRARVIFGAEGPDLDGASLQDFLASEDRKGLTGVLRHALESGFVELRGRRRGGGEFPVEASFTESEVGGERVYTATVRDITARKEAEQALRESEERYMLAARGSNDGLWDWDRRTNKVFYSSRWKSMLGFGQEDVGDSPEDWFNLVHPDDLSVLHRLIDEVHTYENPHFVHEYRIRNYKGEYIWVLLRGIIVCDKDGFPYRMAGSQTDVTDRKHFEERLRHDALHDSLTGLPNRNLFAERLRHAIARAARDPNYLYAVLFLDLDRFKVINDSLGHIVGDKLLQEAAERVRSCIREQDTAMRMPQHAENTMSGATTVARLGGDEFSVLLDDIGSTEDATRVAERIQARLSEPFIIAKHEVYSSASIGIALSTSDYKSPDAVLRDSDTAMYRAKAMGRARHEMFDQELHAQAIRRLQLENDLRRAIDNGEFVQYYQPLVEMDTGRIKGFEALIRWENPDHGLIPPNEFMPIAEETGLIVAIDSWAMGQACWQIRQWREALGDSAPEYVSVNASSKQFTQTDIVSEIRDALAKEGLPGRALNLEILETVIMEDPDALARVLHELRAQGVRLSIDDFGTGYSSLSYLHQFPIDTVKIDRSFVSKITPETKRSDIIDAILQLCKNLNHGVIAEGIEEACQLEYLRSAGCACGQGYYFSRPVPAEEATKLLLGPPWMKAFQPPA